eukprot:10024450-Lingulodinium_polyedra.AAC.1
MPLHRSGVPLRWPTLRGLEPAGRAGQRSRPDNVPNHGVDIPTPALGGAHHRSRERQRVPDPELELLPLRKSTSSIPA